MANVVDYSSNSALIEILREYYGNETAQAVATGTFIGRATDDRCGNARLMAQMRKKKHGKETN